MELSDTEDTGVSIELDNLGDTNIEEVDEPNFSSDIYETEESSSTIFHTLLGEHVETANHLFSLSAFSFILFVIVCITIYPALVLMMQDNNQDVWNYNREALGDIYLTKEYQLELKEDFFAPREEGVERIIREFEKISGMNMRNVTKHHVGVRSQYKFNPYLCTNWQDVERYEYSDYMSALYYEEYGHGYYDQYGRPINDTNDHDGDFLSDIELRVRNWLSVSVGSDVHTSSIDIKKQVPGETEAFLIPFRAADDQLDGSTEKLEEGKEINYIFIYLAEIKSP